LDTVSTEDILKSACFHSATQIFLEPLSSQKSLSSVYFFPAIPISLEPAWRQDSLRSTCSFPVTSFSPWILFLVTFPKILHVTFWAFLFLWGALFLVPFWLTLLDFRKAYVKFPSLSFTSFVQVIPISTGTSQFVVRISLILLC